MKKLDKRVYILGIVFLYILVIRLVIMPNYKAAKRWQRETSVLNQKMNSLSILNSQYQQIYPSLKAVLQKEDFTGLLSKIQNQAQKLGLSENLKTAVPVVRELNSRFRAEGYELRLERVNLKEIILLLSVLEKEGGICLDRLVLEKSKDGMSLSARIRLLTIKRL
ncbi:MAG: hypothetical protein V2A65_05760 [Candidatus Omnitrophota bacterium]